MATSRLRTRVVPALAAVLSAMLFTPVQAQYFGRNTVQYETFDFRVLRTSHFDVYHYEAEAEAGRYAAALAEQWYDRLTPMMGYPFESIQPLIIYANHPHFQQTTAIQGRIGEGTGGVTTPLKRRIVMPMAGALSSTDEVIGHELVHAYQYGIGGVEPSSPYIGSSVAGLPLWLVEGMAAYFSRGPVDVETTMYVRDALLNDRLPRLSDLSNAQEYFPYRWGQALLAYIGGLGDDTLVVDVFRAAARSGSPASAIRDVLNVDADTLVASWHTEIRRAYGTILDNTTPPGEFGVPLVTEESSGGRINVGPSLSPDGTRMILLSERSLFAIELYLADAETGEIIRKLTETAVDPHFQSLQFIESSGGWAGDNRRIAFGAISEGQPILVIMDTETGDRVREMRFPGLGEIYSPTWSPRDDRIAFAANVAGFMDLYVVDLGTGELTRLTRDPWSDLHPSWSPDGSRIAFTTDRFGGDPDRIEPGPFTLATLEVGSGDVRRLPSYRGALHVNPQWAPDGSALFFLSDRGGIMNVHRLDLASGRLQPVTNVTTGVTGITTLSPALTVARNSGRIVASMFDDGNFDIYRLDGAGASRTFVADGGDAAVLPPVDRRSSRVYASMHAQSPPVPESSMFELRDYDAGLSLDYISQPSLAVGAGSFGTFAGGGAALHFSDMLGFHSLTTLVQLEIRDGEFLNGIGALASYMNPRGRLDLGGVVGQVPQYTQAVRVRTADVDGDGGAELVQETVHYWQVDRVARGIVVYPFSTVQRLELSAGGEQISYTLKTNRQAFEPTGERILDRTVEAPACGDSLSFRTSVCEPESILGGTGAVALVYDNAVLGMTGPLLGQRYRFELSPRVGTLSYLAALADFRRYVNVVGPFTLAGRIMHFGRYGGDANDDRLQRLFVGYPELVRGYDPGSFTVGACPQNQGIEQCSEFQVLESLVGTRMAVANVEARLPLTGPLGVLGGRSFPLPITMVGFYDAGVAWTSDEEASFLGGSRDAVTSAGAGLRFNLFGFVVAELDWVHPFDRPLKGSHFTFSFHEGF